ncbi:MAG TPA: type II CAAX endopeptidase family protein, partial [Sunxiuqinia sp.]|nr:type II CAAX endopeptidase family protein [Sunxiuqinia sp.]
MEITQAILQILTAIVVSFFLSVLAMRTIKLTGADLKDVKQRNRKDVLVIAAIFNVLFIIIVSILLKFWNHQSISRLGFSFANKDIVLSVLTFTFTTGLAFLFISYLNRKKIISVSFVKNYFYHATGLSNLLLAFVVLFIAAFQEEILFRGYFALVLFPFGLISALIISSLAFTFWHYLTNKVRFYQTLDWFMGGIMLFLIYWLSGSIWVATIVHFSRNFINVTVFNISSSNAIVIYNKP